MVHPFISAAVLFRIGAPLSLGASWALFGQSASLKRTAPSAQDRPWALFGESASLKNLPPAPRATPLPKTEGFFAFDFAQRSSARALSFRQGERDLSTASAFASASALLKSTSIRSQEPAGSYLVQSARTPSPSTSQGVPPATDKFLSANPAAVPRRGKPAGTLVDAGRLHGASRFSKESAAASKSSQQASDAKLARNAKSAGKDRSSNPPGGHFAPQPYDPLWRHRLSGRYARAELPAVNSGQIERFNNLGIRDHSTEFMEKGKSYVFFTCPDMNIYGQVDPSDKTTSGESASVTAQNILSTRALLDHNILDQLSGKVSDRMPFLKVLTNQALGFRPSDTTMDTRDSKETLQGYKVILPMHMAQSESGDFQVEYSELEDGQITLLHKTWLDYMYYVRRGFIPPKRYNVVNNVLDYAVSAYHFVVGPDGRTIKYWAKYTGVFPKSVPYSSYEAEQNGQPSLVKMQVTYQYSFKEDMDLSIIYDFAVLTGSISAPPGSSLANKVAKVADGHSSPPLDLATLSKIFSEKGVQDILSSGMMIARSAYDSAVNAAKTRLSQAVQGSELANTASQSAGKGTLGDAGAAARKNLFALADKGYEYRWPDRSFNRYVKVAAENHHGVLKFFLLFLDDDTAGAGSKPAVVKGGEIGPGRSPTK